MTLRDFSTGHEWLSINTATVRKQLGVEAPLARIIEGGVDEAPARRAAERAR